MVFSEGDGLSGLVVDRYADYLAVQVTSLGIARRMEQIVPLLVELAWLSPELLGALTFMVHGAIYYAVTDMLPKEYRIFPR